jgi:hypothetical protein
MIWYMKWYIYMQLGWHPVAVVQYTFTHKQYIEQHNSQIGWLIMLIVGGTSKNSRAYATKNYWKLRF